MKKLLIIITFLFCMVGMAQEGDKTQFTTNYSEIYLSTTDSYISKEIRIMFNYSNDPSKIKVFIGSEVRMLTQFIETTLKKTPEGDEYYELITKDDKGEIIVVQYFGEKVLRLLFSDGSWAVLLQ